MTSLDYRVLYGEHQQNQFFLSQGIQLVHSLSLSLSLSLSFFSSLLICKTFPPEVQLQAGPTKDLRRFFFTQESQVDSRTHWVFESALNWPPLSPKKFWGDHNAGAPSTSVI